MDRYQSTILCHFIGLADSHITHPHLSQTFTIVVTVVLHDPPSVIVIHVVPNPYLQLAFLSPFH